MHHGRVQRLQISVAGYMADLSRLCRQAGCVRPYTPVLDGVQDCGILS